MWRLAALATAVVALLLTDIDWQRLAVQILLDEQEAALIGCNMKAKGGRLDSVYSVTRAKKGQPAHCMCVCSDACQPF